MESIYMDAAIQSQLSKCTAKTVSSDAAIPKDIKKKKKNLILLDSVHDDDWLKLWEHTTLATVA